MKGPILGTCRFGREEQKHNTVVQHAGVEILYYQNVPILYPPIFHGRSQHAPPSPANPYTHNLVLGLLRKTSHFTFGLPLLERLLHYRLYTETKRDGCMS